MPILKVSKNLRQAMELMKVPAFSRPINCPRCTSSDYKDGICGACDFIDPTVAEMQQEFYEAQGIKQQLQQKAASGNGFIDQLPSVMQERSDCPKCVEHGDKNTMIDGKCEKCGHDIPPEGLGFKESPFVGIDYNKVEMRRAPFKSPVEQKIDKAKKQLKKKKSAKEQQPVDPGLFQDDATNAANDATTRMNQLLQTDAQMKAQNPNEEQQ